MKLINLAYGLQSLEVLLAISSELKAQGVASKIVTCLKLLPSMRIADASYLFEMVDLISDQIYIVGRSAGNAAACSFFEKRTAGRCCRVLPGVDIRLQNAGVRLLGDRFFDKFYCDLLGEIDEETVLLRSHADVDSISSSLGVHVRRAGGRVFVCLDGMYPPGDSISLRYFKAAMPEAADTFLLFHDSHDRTLRGVGYDKTYTIGYPTLYSSWIDKVYESSGYRAFSKDGDRTRVALFTRGETHDASSNIMPNDTLTEILEDVVSSVRERDPGAEFVVKPHPLQDDSPIKRLVERYDCVSRTNEHPAVLAATSDIVVSTWSTSIIYGMIYGKSVIEYFRETDYFRTLYPNGSSFRDLGIMWAEDRRGFDRCLDLIFGGGHEQPDPRAVFGDRNDLSVFADRKK